MASKEIQLIISAKDETQKAFNSINKSLQGIGVDFKKMATGGAIAFGAISGAIGFSVKEAIEAQTAQNRLAQLLRVTNDATDEQVAVLLDQAEALEKVGVMSKDNIVTAQSQLATFDLQIDSIKALTPSIMDYVTAEKGMSATTEDVRALTNGLAQALNGNFSSLTKTGFVLDDVTKNLISNGTELERAEALASVLDSTYKDFNKTATETAQGSLILLNRSFGDMKEAIGNALLPYLAILVEKILPIMQKFKEWAEENPKLISTITGIALAITGAITAIGLIGMTVPKIIDGIYLLKAVFTTQLGWIVFAIMAVIAIIWLLIENWDKIKDHPVVKVIWETLKTAIDNIVTVFTQNLLPILQEFWKSLEFLRPFLETFFKIMGVLILGALLAVIKAIEIGLIVAMTILGKQIQITTKVLNFIKDAWEDWIDVLSRVIGWVDNLINKIKELNIVKSGMNAVSNFVGGVFGGGKASGGFVSSNKSYLVGEQGPEIFSPSISGSIIPNSKIGGGGNYININITGNTIQTADDITELVNEGLNKALRLNNQLSY